MEPGPRDDNPPLLITSPGLKNVGIVALVALTGELLVLRWLIPLDDALWRGILYARGCSWDHRVGLATDVATTATIVLLAIAAVASLRAVGPRTTWPPLAVCAVGLFAGKVLKNFFARERPSMIGDVALGHSFPSTHVMNTALAALAIVLLATRSRRLRGWWALPGALLITNCAGRLLVAHHWLTDVVGGLLAALAVIGLTLPAFRSRPLLAPSIVMLALGAVLGIDLSIRALEIRLPSPLSTPREAVAQVVTAAALGTATMLGSWEPATEGIRGHPSAAWLHGSGMITLEVPGRNDLNGRNRDTALEPGAVTTLVVAGRPDIRVPGCGELQVTVNQTMLRAFVPFVGWREYRLIVPAGAVHPGRNEVQIDFEDAGVPKAFAIAYLRLVSR